MNDKATTTIKDDGHYVTIRTYWRGHCVSVWVGTVAAWTEVAA